MRSRREPARPSAVPGAIAAMIDGEGFADTPLGGYQGAMLPTTPPVVSVPGPPLRIDPPPWAGHEGDLSRYLDAAPSATADTGPRVGPVDQMLAQDADWPEPPGPPLVYEPLQRPVFPAPQWRDEEIERGLQASGATQDALESHDAPAQPTYPARAQT